MKYPMLALSHVIKNISSHPARLLDTWEYIFFTLQGVQIHWNLNGCDNSRVAGMDAFSLCAKRVLWTTLFWFWPYWRLYDHFCDHVCTKKPTTKRNRWVDLKCPKVDRMWHSLEQSSLCACRQHHLAQQSCQTRSHARLFEGRTHVLAIWFEYAAK